jgi:ParB family chromosome partitioning protein
MPSTPAAVVHEPTTRTIDQLCLSPLNVRIDPAATSPKAIAVMEASLMARGQLEPILVHPLRGNTRKWGAHAGGRRYRAFKNLIERGDLPRDHAIRVEIRANLSDAELLAESMVENIGRRDLEPYETFDGVRRMSATGASVVAIAAALGQEEAAIARMLRLGNLPKPIFEALSAGRISEDQARAFGATADAGVQLAAWQRLSGGAATFTVPPDRIRAAIGIGDADAAKLLAFVGERAYLDAGGRLEPDLFATAEQPRDRVVDLDRLRELADSALDIVRTEVRRATGRPDLRFIAEPPKDKHGTTTDWDLRASGVQAGNFAAKVDLPDGDIVARLVVDPSGKAAVDYWWASRSAKYANRRGPAAAAASPRAADAAIAAEKLAPAAAIGQQYDGAKQIADAALREEEGLSAESVDVFRSVRRTILRGLLIENAELGGHVARDWLVWTQLRLGLEVDSRPRAVGVAKWIGAEGDPAAAIDVVRAMPAHKGWRDALEELGRKSFATDEDLASAFADYRASDGRLQRLAEAVVAAWSLERSLAEGAAGYGVRTHDELARQLGIYAHNHDVMVRQYWTPGEKLLGRIPRGQLLAMAEPLVEPESFTAWTKAKVGEVVARLVALVNGAEVRGARADRARAASTWVHPLLRFMPAPAGPDNDKADVIAPEKEAA